MVRPTLRSACSCLNLILACIVYWQASEISRVLSQCDPVANGIDLSLLEHVSPIEWDNVVLYGQYILTGSSSAGAVAQKGSPLAYKITRICLARILHRFPVLSIFPDDESSDAAG